MKVVQLEIAFVTKKVPIVKCVSNFALPVRAASKTSISEKIIARGESSLVRNATYALSAREGTSASDLTWLLKRTCNIERN